MLFKKNYLIYLAYSILINLRQGQLKIVQKWQFENVRTIPLRVDTLNNKSVNPRGYFAL